MGYIGRGREGTQRARPLGQRAEEAPATAPGEWAGKRAGTSAPRLRGDIDGRHCQAPHAGNLRDIARGRGRLLFTLRGNTKDIECLTSSVGRRGKQAGLAVQPPPRVPTASEPSDVGGPGGGGSSSINRHSISTRKTSPALLPQRLFSTRTGLLFVRKIHTPGASNSRAE